MVDERDYAASDHGGILPPTLALAPALALGERFGWPRTVTG